MKLKINEKISCFYKIGILTFDRYIRVKGIFFLSLLHDYFDLKVKKTC